MTELVTTKQNGTTPDEQVTFLNGKGKIKTEEKSELQGKYN